MKHRNNTIDEARDEESELGFNNNGVRDEARDEERERERDKARQEEKSF